MKSNKTATASALLMLAGSLLPAYGQRRGNENGWNRADGSQQRAFQPDQQRGQFREQQARPQTQAPQSFYRQDTARQQSFQQQPQRDFSRQRDFQQQNYQQRQSFQQQNYQQRQGFQQSRGYQEQRDFNRQSFAPRQDFRDSRTDQFRYRQNFRGGESFGGFRSNGFQDERRGWSQRGGYRGYVIPRERFYTSFGRQHFFRLGRPAYYEGYPRFQYGGYSFELVDPWPTYWGDDWYDSDDVYVDYQDDGYYLFNRRYPGAGISINIGF